MQKQYCVVRNLHIIFWHIFIRAKFRFKILWSVWKSVTLTSHSGIIFRICLCQILSGVPMLQWFPKDQCSQVFIGFVTLCAPVWLRSYLLDGQQWGINIGNILSDFEGQIDSIYKHRSQPQVAADRGHAMFRRYHELTSHHAKCGTANNFVFTYFLI